MQNLKSLIRFLLVGSLIFKLAACSSPVQGYSGHKLPPEQIALVVAKPPIWAASIDGIALNSSGITVLPGVHTIVVTRLLKNPYDCFEHTNFDSSGYDSCITTRNYEIYKDMSPRTCYTSSYTESYTNCQVDNTEYTCKVKTKLEANENYQIDDRDQKSGPILLMSVKSLPLNIPCKFTQKWTAREERKN